MKISQSEAYKKSKFGINLEVYPLNNPSLGLVHTRTEKGHFEEFYHTVSTFTYYIIKGEGTFYLDGVPNAVVAGDVVVIPPNTKLYYLGTLELLLLTTPAWTEEAEVHVRDIE